MSTDSPTLRTALSQAWPHVATKKAWTETIRLLRLAKKRGIPSTLHSRGSVEKLLTTSVNASMDVSGLKQLLGHVLTLPSESDKINAAVTIDRMTSAWVPTTIDTPVLVSVHGWPDWVTNTTREALTGLKSACGLLPPNQAAALNFHMDGFQIAKHRLQVEIELPDGSCLPPPQRRDRARKRTRGTKPWLPFYDEEGRYSATPKELSMQHGRVLADTGLPVLDPFCGLGGDAIGAAMAGAQVIASDIHNDRLRLAQRNAKHFNVHTNIAFQQCDVKRALEQVNISGFCLYLDPPWGGTNWDKDAANLGHWLSRWPCLEHAIQACGAVLLKAPRTFDLDSLHSLRTSWVFDVGVESTKDHPADQIRIIRAFGC